MSRMNAQDKRIAAIIGEDDDSSLNDGVEKFYVYLNKSLQLPCDVTGVEDFRWEEYWVVGPGDPKEHARLCLTRPSYRDKFELLAIEKGVWTEWMMFHGDDLAAHVRRKSDGKEFHLGLAELKAVDKKSKNYQLIDDFAVWLVNNR